MGPVFRPEMCPQDQAFTFRPARNVCPIVYILAIAGILGTP